MKVTFEKAKRSVSTGTCLLDASLPRKIALNGRQGIYRRTLFLWAVLKTYTNVAPNSSRWKKRQLCFYDK